MLTILKTNPKHPKTTISYPSIDNKGDAKAQKNFNLDIIKKAIKEAQAKPISIICLQPTRKPNK